MVKQRKPALQLLFRGCKHEICLFSALRKAPAAFLSKKQNLKNSEVLNFSLDIDGYKVYNADYNNVTMR